MNEEMNAFTLNTKEYIAAAIDTTIQASHDTSNCPHSLQVRKPAVLQAAAVAAPSVQAHHVLPGRVADPLQGVRVGHRAVARATA